MDLEPRFYMGLHRSPLKGVGGGGTEGGVENREREDGRLKSKEGGKIEGKRKNGRLKGKGRRED